MSASPPIWGMPIPALNGWNIFPPLSSVIVLLASKHPGNGWNQLEGFLWEVGVNSLEHILLADLTVLALVGNMEVQQATVLRNYALSPAPGIGSGCTRWTGVSSGNRPIV